MNKNKPAFTQGKASEATQSSQVLENKESEMEKDPYKISNYKDFPQSTIGYMRTKVYQKQNSNEGDKKAITKGTCCFIDKNIVLTVAHNLVKYQQRLFTFENLKRPYQDVSYVKQGLGDSNCIRKYSIQKIFIKFIPEDPNQQHFQPEYLSKISQQEDYALVLVKPMPLSQQQKEIEIPKQQYMPIVMLSKAGQQQMIQFEIPGYPVKYNKDKKKGSNDSSCYMHDQFKTSGELNPFEKNIIHYQAQYQQGFSGAPLIVSQAKNNQKIIIAIHKGMNRKTKQGMGIAASSMIQQLNKLGYQLKKKPFVFTEKTLKLRGKQQQMSKRQILLLTDQQLQAHDMLVYTSYDFSNLKAIYLTGNYIGEKGVQILLRRKFPKLTSLFLTQNSIGDIKADNQLWKNVEKLQILSLASNKLTTLPEGIRHLTNLTKLWLTKNEIRKVPQSLITYCEQNNRNNLAIIIYGNKIDQLAEKPVIQKLKGNKYSIIWHQGSQQ